MAFADGSNDIQIQTTLGIIADTYLEHFEIASMALSQTITTRFLMKEQVRIKRNFGVPKKMVQRKHFDYKCSNCLILILNLEKFSFFLQPDPLVWGLDVFEVIILNRILYHGYTDSTIVS